MKEKYTQEKVFPISLRKTFKKTRCEFEKYLE